MLLIDDIQGFANRKGTQASFFQVFEHMVPHGKQIVMTSDTFPRDLKELQERLLSRITQGITVEVEPPELEMRVQILLNKAERSGLSMPEDVAEEIAKRLRSNVRELEGAVQQILAYTHFHKVPVTLQTVSEALRNVFRSSSVPVTIETIQEAVSDYFKIKTADLLSKKRTSAVSHARQVAMYLAKELTQKSLPEKTIRRSFMPAEKFPLRARPISSFATTYICSNSALRVRSPFFSSGTDGWLVFSMLARPEKTPLRRLISRFPVVKCEIVFPLQKTNRATGKRYRSNADKVGALHGRLSTGDFLCNLLSAGERHFSNRYLSSGELSRVARHFRF